MSAGDLLDEISIAAGLLLIGWSVRMFRVTRVWLSKCVTTEGRIVGSSESYDSDGGPTFYDRIQFTDQNGEMVEVGGPHGRQAPPKPGERVSITYDPTYPKNASLTGSYGVWVIPAIVLLAGAVALVVGLGLHFGIID